MTNYQSHFKSFNVKIVGTATLIPALDWNAIFMNVRTPKRVNNTLSTAKIT
jgi:hypothetical protein